MLSAAVAGGGGRVVWAMLVAVQTVLVMLLTPVGCDPNVCSFVSQRHSVNQQVCSFEPKGSPPSVECDLKGGSIRIEQGNLPASVRRLHIVNANHVELDESALSALNTAENIHFENITHLVIKGNVVGPGEQRGHVSVTLNRISNVCMAAHSFKHWREKSLNISIANIDTCNIHGEAIVSNSSSSNVVLENITEGRFYRNTFSTTLGELTLNNVTTTRPCQQKTFAGNIGKLSLTSVKLRDVKEGCFDANQAWNSLTVRSSHLGNISNRGLRGRIGDVRIEESTLGRISTNGFDLDVSGFSINASSIEVLERQALNVRASGRISLLMSNVSTIRENAFRSLNSSKGIRLDQLAVSSVFNGSLIFYDVRSLTLRELQLRIPCECNILKQVTKLFFEQGHPNTRKELERLMPFRYVAKINCSDSHTTPSLLEYHCNNCVPRREAICDNADRTKQTKHRKTDKTSSASAVPAWVPLVALFGCFLLLGAVITLLVIIHRRRSAHRRRTPRPNRPPSQRLTAADLRHRLPDLPRDGQQMDSACQSPGGERPGEVPQTVAAGSTVYSSVYANIPEATVGSAVCENVSGVASCEDQALYEEIYPQGQTRGEEEAGFRAESSQAPPLYAEVNKGKGKSATTSDDFEYAVDSSDPPVYAQVNKTKARTIQRSRETTHHTANTRMSGTEAASNVSETSPTDDTTADIPVYAQVSKNKPDGKNRSVNKQAAHPEPEQTQQPPIYAQVKKNQPTASSQTNRHDRSQQTWQPSDTSLYEVSRLAPEESPLYAGIIYSAAESADSKEIDDFSEGLHYNALYGVNISPKD